MRCINVLMFPSRNRAQNLRLNPVVREDAAMKKIPKVIYQTPEELDRLIKEREATAAALPPESAQPLLVEIAQLRMYADAKRWAESPGLQPGK
jgi:hypothetical protein